jgi:signal transduction histidine kinase
MGSVVEHNAIDIPAGTGVVVAGGPDLAELLYRYAPVAFAQYDRSFAIRRFNPTWAAFVARYTHSDPSRIVEGANLFDLAPGTEAETIPLFARVLAGEVVRQDGLRLESEGIVSYWDTVLVPVFSDEQARQAGQAGHAGDGERTGEVVGIVEVTVDATDRMLAYHNLEQRVGERTRELERRKEVAESLRDIFSVLNSNQTPAEILQYLITRARRLLSADTAVIFRLQPDRGVLTVQAVEGLGEERIAGLTAVVGEGAIGQAVLKREPVVISDIGAMVASVLAEHTSEQEVDLRRALTRMARYYRSALAMPLIVRGEIYGGISLYYECERQFSGEDLELAATFAQHAAMAIESTHLRQQVEQAAVTAERHRIARDLHDSVTQTLFSASLVAKVLPRLWERNQDEGRQQLEELRQLTGGALAEMRVLLLELRPSRIVDTPLDDLLRQLADSTAGRGRVPTVVKAERECNLPSDVHMAIYRIAQEALNNVAKHSGASRASVDLRCSPGHTELNIYDDGCGFDPCHISGDHMGLDIMHERAREVGATCLIESEPGGGTRIQVTWSNESEPQGAQRAQRAQQAQHPKSKAR